MKRFKKVLTLFVIFLLVALFSACTTKVQDNIIILYTSDVHGAYQANIGLNGLKSYKEECMKESEYVTLVDVGDFIDGTPYDLYSKGEDMVDMRNKVGYDILTFGNHEFGFGMDQLKKLMDMSNGEYIVCDIEYTGKKENIFKDTNPYTIKEYGKYKVGYIGVATPMTYSDNKTSIFEEDGERVYYFYESLDGQLFYNQVQKTIDEIRNKVDYVVLLGHLGTQPEATVYQSTNLISNITGVDVLLDGHAHATIESQIVKDKEGNNVILSAVGTKMTNIGRLEIKNNGDISTSLVQPDTTEIKDTIIGDRFEKYDEIINQKAFELDFDLKITDDDGIRMVRNREVAIGDLVTDAFAYFGETEIAFTNAGGVRDNLLKGDVSIADIIKVVPFENYIVIVKGKGQMLLDGLEYAYMSVESEYKADGSALGESGGFFQVSGLKFDVDTSIPSPVVVKEDQSFDHVDGERRVKNVKVLENGKYVDIDPDKYYTFTSNDFLLLNGGGGNTVFAECELIRDTGALMKDALIQYIVEYLKGDLSKYKNVGDRITIK